MATFCFRCKNCQSEYTTPDINLIPDKCYSCGSTEIMRDYKAESVGFFIPSHMRSSNTSSRDDFLPTAKDFESPLDPDGSKGILDWNENHEPAAGNKAPHRPKIPAGGKRVYTLGGSKRAN